jgi:hypothetical protein
MIGYRDKELSVSLTFSLRRHLDRQFYIYIRGCRVGITQTSLLLDTQIAFVAAYPRVQIRRRMENRRWWYYLEQLTQIEFSSWC